MTKIIGLTGGIGSGKSTIASYFKSLGIPVYIADDASRNVTALPKVRKQIKNQFGADVFNGSGLNRQKLAQLVFSDPEKLKQLNAIIHPAVKADFDLWLTQHANAPIVIKEAAILFESGSYKNCDAIITITAPEEIRIARVIKRDGVTRDEVLRRIANQWTDAQRIAKSDYVIDNTNGDEAKAQADKILKKLTIR
ncbi:MAG TPA: dephospho-CoA kinase [Flavobacterium sp.]|nr:dephospho-CoA kinase [Flavobacterium sp.]